MLDSNESVFWILIIAFVIAFILAFGVGANDVANSFGTSVGSGVLTIRQACFLATIFEILGSALLGYKVASTVRLGVFDINIYDEQEKILMLGYLSALIGGAMWNLLATFAKLPISGTHSIIGAVLGFTLVLKGLNGLKWNALATIVISWFVSPLVSGAISVLMCYLITKFIIAKPDSLEPGLKALPLFYGATIFINLFSILHDGPSFFHLDKMSWWTGLLISIIIGLITSLVVWVWVVPVQRVNILESLQSKTDHQKEINISKSIISSKTVSSSVDRNDDLILESINPDNLRNDVESGIAHPSIIPPKSNLKSCDGDASFSTEENDRQGKDNSHEMTLRDKPEVAQIFKYLQILTACFGSFAHGANDVSNAIGPLIAVYLIWTSGNVFQSDPAPYWLMLFGGIGISVGLIVWGQRVIKTVGSDLTKITPFSGFCIEIGSAATVLLASKIGLPISTTHCKVGSVVLVGKYGHKKNTVDWSLFGNIVFAWVLTVPATAFFSAFSMYMLKSIVIRNYTTDNGQYMPLSDIIYTLPSTD